MIYSSLARRASRVFRAPSFLHHSLIAQQSSSYHSSSQCRGLGFSNGGLISPYDLGHLTAPFSSSSAVAGADSVKGFYDKIIESIEVKRSAPPNAWLWSLIEKCKSKDDIKLLFDALQKIRVFRLSNLRIHDNFNCNLCQEVAKACTRSGAVEYGKKALWKHNIYGLSPTIGSANQLLSHAKTQKDVKLMVDIMRHLKKSNLSLQPATADIVFSICYEVDDWDLMCKYSKRFTKAGVKLRKTTIDLWMEFASKRGDLESLWKIEKSRSDMYKQHTIKSGISCAKGFLLERKPSDAAAVIQDVNQKFPDSKRQDIINEVQKMVSEWPAEVIKNQKQEGRKALAGSLKADIPAMLNFMSSMGLKSSFDLKDFKIEEPLSC